MGFFFVDRDQVKRYITRFIEWLKVEHDTKPRKRLPESGEVVNCFKRVPISNSTYPGGEAWIVVSLNRDSVQGFYRPSRWDAVIEYPVLRAGGATKTKENGSQQVRAKGAGTSCLRSNNEKHKVTDA